MHISTQVSKNNKIIKRMKNQFEKLDLFTQIKDSAKEAKNPCGAVLGLLWILGFTAYCIYSIVAYDVSTPIVSIEDRDATSLPGTLSLQSMNWSLSVGCFYSSTASQTGPLDCTSNPNVVAFTYNNVKSLESYNEFPAQMGIYDQSTWTYSTESYTGKNWSYPFAIEFSKFGSSLTFAEFLIKSNDPDVGVQHIDLKFTLTSVQIDYSTGHGEYVTTEFFESMNSNDKEYHYEFQVQDYYIKSKSQFSNAETFYRKIHVNKKFDSLGSNSGVSLKFKVNPLAQSTKISYKKYLDLLSTLGGFWTSILGILSLIYLTYWKALVPLVSKCRRKKDMSRVQDTKIADESMRVEDLGKIEMTRGVKRMENFQAPKEAQEMKMVEHSFKVDVRESL